MAAKLVAALPQGEDWLFELKFDGYRALILKDGDSVEIRSRKGCPHVVKDISGASLTRVSKTFSRRGDCR
jgi:hypothetical protein